MSHLPVFESSLAKSEQWLDELAAELGIYDRQRAYAVLRATLHALRDRLAVAEAADLAAQLPMVVRGLYYEGWRPAGVPVKGHRRDEFLAPVARALFTTSTDDTERAARAVLGLLARHVSAGELEDLIRVLPEEIRALFPESALAAASR